MENSLNIIDIEANDVNIDNLSVKSRNLKMKCEITDFNTYLFHEGKNFNSYVIMGAHIVNDIYEGKRKRGVRFTVWAPKAKNVYVTGDFNNFQVDSRYKMNKLTELGLWSLFIPKLEDGTKYKYAVENIFGNIVYKADPYAFKSELRPRTASIVVDEKRKDYKYKWNDRSWMAKRRWYDMKKSPVNIYEVHLGSWKKKNGEFLTYRELAEELPEYLKRMNYTHVEIMPIAEHPLDKSWGYQATGYYSVTSRFGDRNDFKYLIDKLHQFGIGIILDWVPGHFCKDEHGLYKFDGTATFEYEEEWKSDNSGWGTSNFDLGKPEVKSFLISNAVYWIKEFHIDGLRVDAVSNMIYLDYGRENDYWRPNKYGHNLNLEGIDFLQELNSIVKGDYFNVMMIAEEATAFKSITKTKGSDGLGFDFKWNMGWMNDTLSYIEEDPIYRKYNHNKINFSMMYNYNENYILPISHDEVVHGKKSLVNKMWGDHWTRLATVRLYMAHMIGHPGKKLLFMGSEFGQSLEWRDYESLEWNLLETHDFNKKTQYYFESLNKFYKDNKALWEMDYDPKGYEWIDADNNEQSILSFIRYAENKKDILIFICNYTPVVRYGFKVGVPYLCEYKEVFNTDRVEFGGSGQLMKETLVAIEEPHNNQKYSIEIKVPPMGAVVLAIKNNKK